MLYSLLCVDSQTTWNFKAKMSSAQVQSLWRLKCKKWSFTLGFKNDSPKIKGSDFSDGEGARAYGGLMVCTTNGEDGSFQLKLCELQPRWFSFRTSVLYDIQKKRKKKKWTCLPCLPHKHLFYLLPIATNNNTFTFFDFTIFHVTSFIVLQ